MRSGLLAGGRPFGRPFGTSVWLTLAPISASRHDRTSPWLAGCAFAESRPRKARVVRNRCIIAVYSYLYFPGCSNRAFIQESPEKQLATPPESVTPSHTAYNKRGKYPSEVPFRSNPRRDANGHSGRDKRISGSRGQEWMPVRL
jgi:hypothetical protein